LANDFYFLFSVEQSTLIFVSPTLGLKNWRKKTCQSCSTRYHFTIAQNTQKILFCVELATRLDGIALPCNRTVDEGLGSQGSWLVDEYTRAKKDGRLIKIENSTWE
jgi:hypothetical protein